MNALKLAKISSAVAKETGANIVICPPHTDIGRIAAETDITVWGQGADAVEPGGKTAHMPVEALKESGASGILINHSERKLTMADIDFINDRAKSIGMTTCICTNNVRVSAACSALEPDYIAVEPPELIGGDVSVTSADPSVVSGSVAAVRKISDSVTVLCGAGVKNGEDVRKAIHLGSGGVLVASGVVKAKNHEAAIRDLLSGFFR